MHLSLRLLFILLLSLQLTIAPQNIAVADDFDDDFDFDLGDDELSSAPQKEENKNESSIFSGLTDMFSKKSEPADKNTAAPADKKATTALLPLTIQPQKTPAPAKNKTAAKKQKPNKISKKAADKRKILPKEKPTAQAIAALWTVTGNLDVPGGMCYTAAPMGVDQPSAGAWGIYDLIDEEIASFEARAGIADSDAQPTIGQATSLEGVESPVGAHPVRPGRAASTRQSASHRRMHVSLNRAKAAHQAFAICSPHANRELQALTPPPHVVAENDDEELTMDLYRKNSYQYFMYLTYDSKGHLEEIDLELEEY